MGESEHQLTKKMKQEKEDFLKKFKRHEITDHGADDFAKATQGKDSHKLNVVSVEKTQKKKRASDDELEQLEEKLSKDKKHKRQKH